MREATRDIAGTFAKHPVENIIGHGFGALNLGNYMLGTQMGFSKMGRYRPDCLEIVGLYRELLRDMNHYSEYLKLTVQHLIHHLSQQEKQHRL